MEKDDAERASGQWRKSSFSGSDGSNCVEVARLARGRYGVRDSKDAARAVVVVGAAEWVAFLDHVKAC
ncbi:hypothetical protein Sme01_15030 [Sphaerisporangium melleum]|uniref:DUF397 domain-containing protein n=1 Tax=Sphaerisporangium melleum TaxID=321316 RepID=A0A917QUH3_9ACTN|nr:DUF397 domain-containing protein [Sphaerisporangium melleum]GGK69487.1 hypothetical protein GCM10007964_10630 [Sphaerisporangium melleum]GII69027.1 hypothetical protein Sme01_15030 [Sphaerisporangium melleum]